MQFEDPTGSTKPQIGDTIDLMHTSDPLIKNFQSQYAIIEKYPQDYMADKEHLQEGQEIKGMMLLRSIHDEEGHFFLLDHKHKLAIKVYGSGTEWNPFVLADDLIGEEYLLAILLSLTKEVFVDDELFLKRIFYLDFEGGEKRAELKVKVEKNNPNPLLHNLAIYISEIPHNAGGVTLPTYSTTYPVTVSIGDKNYRATRLTSPTSQGLIDIVSINLAENNKEF